MCVFLFSFFHSLTFFVEVILAVRVIWIDVSTFECILESICRAGQYHQSSRARIPGVPKIGVQNLLLHTAKASYDGEAQAASASRQCLARWEWLGSTCPSKKGAFAPFYISFLFVLELSLREAKDRPSSCDS